MLTAPARVDENRAKDDHAFDDGLERKMDAGLIQALCRECR